jgi:hypothetical protein
MDERNYGIQTDHPTKEELDQRWIRIVARGIALGLIAVLVVIIMAYFAVAGLYNAVTGEAVCESVPCSVALDR